MIFILRRAFSKLFCLLFGHCKFVCKLFGLVSMEKSLVLRKKPFSRPALGLADVPPLVLRCILSNLSFHQIANLRLVCKSFDIEGQATLNAGADRLLEYSAKRMEKEKAKIQVDITKLPRWHKMRHDHDLMLNVNDTVREMCEKYGKYLVEKKCCFIAGKILDEVWRYIDLVDRKCEKLAGDLMHELSVGWCWMAEEHFEEVVLHFYLNPRPPFCTRCSEREAEDSKKPKRNLTLFWRNKAREIRAKMRVREIKIHRLRKQIKVEKEKYLDNEHALGWFVEKLKPERQWEVSEVEVKRNPFYQPR